MARLLPTDPFRKIDQVVANVDGVLERVEGTLISVDSTLAEATAVLGEVRDLLVGLRSELDLLQQVPGLATQLGEIHALVTSLAAPKKTKSKKALPSA